MIEPGTKLGPYEILSPIGAGGMGEVYRARDGRLGREVAIKVLPQHLTANEEVRARFSREAKLVSSLNHPNICTLFDVGREGETDYLVMELIEGETLAERLRRGPLPGPELLRLAVQIADALDRAHRAGVIHRDLKPGNVMLTRAGAKLMDFGLARPADLARGAGSGSSASALTRSPTVGQALTAEGTIVGTFQYMAPEQLEGREADMRSDIWALGCVLYEMATGKRAFEGRSQATLIAAIIGSQPAPIAETPSGAPPTGELPPAGLDRLVRACLAKDPEERVQTAHGVKQQLQWIAEGAGLTGAGPITPATGSATPAIRVARAGGAGLAWGIAAAVVVGAGALLAWAWPRATAPPLLVRFHPDTEVRGASESYWPRVSPDGRSLVFVAADSAGVHRAYLLRLSETMANVIPGTDELQRPYWSPDSREIAFVAGDKILRVPAAGGSPTIVCPAPGGSDLSWGAKGLILLDGGNRDSLRVVPAGGGELRPATRIDRANREIGSGWPSFLPDGEHFLFIGTRSDVSRGNIRLGRIGSLDSKLLGASDGRVEYAPGGWVLYVNGTALVAQKLDLRAGKLVGQKLTLVDDLRVGSAAGNFSVSRDGVFAFQRSPGPTGLEMHLADRAGTIAAPVLAIGTLGNPRLSPDGQRVLYERKGAAGVSWGDVSVVDLARGTDTRLTFTDGRAVSAQWSPDGQRFAYARIGPDRQARLMIASVDGLGAQDSIDTSANPMFPSQWAEAGSRLVGQSNDGLPLVVPVDGGDRTLRVLLPEDVPLTNPRISPDGLWVAGTHGTPPDLHVYVQRLEGPPGRWQISPSTGRKPAWTKGGRELVYEGMDGRLMAVDIDTRAGFHVGTPRALFRLPVTSFGREITTWSCDATGQKFVLITPERTRGTGRTIEVLTDFRSLVTRK